MSNSTYLNSQPYEITCGDVGHPATIKIFGSSGSPADLSAYPDMVLVARLTAVGDKVTEYGQFTCSPVDLTVGEFSFPGFGEGDIA